MAIYYGVSKTQYVLDSRLGGGGEGEVYSIQGRRDLVAKLYISKKFKPTKYNPNPRQQLKEKIETMLDQPVRAYTPKGILIVAWPQDALYDGSGQFVGYTMPRVQSRHYIFEASRERDRKILYPNYTWRTAVTIAYNLAMAVWSVNSTGAVVGDMNPHNIMVNKHGRVTLIDTDSFNITNKRTGKTYKCSVGVSEMLPPELQGVNLADPTNKFTSQTDGFSLSIHVFNLLMNNCHPFGVSGMSKSKSSSSNEPVAKHIARGNCPYVTGRQGQGAADAPDVAMLPKYIRNLFDRAFSYDVTTAVKASTIAKRPTSEEWMTALGQLLRSSMTTCNQDMSHVYPAGYGKCPWCEADNRYKKLMKELTVPPVNVGNGFSGSNSLGSGSMRYGTVGTQTSGYGTLGLSSFGSSTSTSGMSHPATGGTGLVKKGRRKARLRRREKRMYVVAAFAIIVALTVAAYVAIKNHLRDQYAQADALWGAGNYSEAADAFKELGSYSDAKERALDAMYQNAVSLMAAGNYDEAAAAFEELSDYSDSEERALDAKYQKAEVLLRAGNKPAAAMAFGALGGYQDARVRSFAIWDEIAVRETISGGNTHVAGLKSDGTVVAAGENEYGQCDVDAWTDIIAVSAGVCHTVGLKSDGTVVAVGENTYGECDLGSWTDIVAIAAGNRNTVGLRSDGTVMVVCYDQNEQRTVESWTDIVAVSADREIVGLKSDGTAVGAGNESIRVGVYDWMNIVSISTDFGHTVGLKSDGTVVGTGRNGAGELNVDKWGDIVAISTGSSHTVGLKADGSLVVVGEYGIHADVESWTNIVAVSAGTNFTVGLKSDGTVVFEGWKSWRKNVDWSGIKVPDK